MKKKKDVNIVEKYFNQINFLIFDVIAIIVAAVGVIMMFLGLGLSFIAIPIILVGALIKLGALMFEIKDSDFLDLVNHLKEIADIDYREKVCFEQYDIPQAPIRQGRDHLYRSNHLTVSLFSFDKKYCIIELYDLYIKEDTFEKNEYKIPLSTKVEVTSEDALVEKHYAAYLIVHGDKELKIPVISGSMDLEGVLERFGG